MILFSNETAKFGDGKSARPRAPSESAHTIRADRCRGVCFTVRECITICGQDGCGGGGGGVCVCADATKTQIK